MKIENENYNIDLFSSKLKNIVSRNQIMVKSNNKYGIVISDSILIQPIYDSIIMLNYIDNTSGNNIHYFLVGVKDHSKNKMYFGTIDIYGNIVIPIKYERIDFQELYSRYRLN